MRFRFSIRFLLLITAAVGFLLLVGQRVGGPVIPKHQLNRIQLGMTQDEVRSILGTPRDVTKSEWQYEQWPNLGWVEIWFDDQGLVAGINDESPFP